MAKKKHSALGKRLIAAAKEIVAHARGELELEEYVVRVSPQVDVITIRKRLGLSQAEFTRRFGFSPRPSGLGAGPAEARERRAGIFGGGCAGAEGGGSGAKRSGVAGLKWSGMNPRLVSE